MITPMQELIEQLKEQVQFIIDKEELKALYGCNDHTEDRMWRSGMREAIKKAESMLEKEKEVMCEFAKIWDKELDEPKIRRVEDCFDETFKTKER